MPVRNMQELLEIAVVHQASDLHLAPGIPQYYGSSGASHR